MQTPSLPTSLRAALAISFALPWAAAGQDRIPSHHLYVCIQDDASIAIVDMDAVEVVSVIRLPELGFRPRAAPHDVAVAADGENWYVSLVGEHQVLKLDAGNEVVGTFEMESPGMLGLSPLGDRLAVSRSMSATNPPRLLGLAHTAEMEAEELDVFFPRPHAVAFSPDGRFAYTASLGVNQLASIDLASLTVELLEVPGPQHALVQLALSPDGEVLVASGELSGELLVFSLDDPARPELVTAIALGPRPFDPVFAPDGQTVWVPIKGRDEVAVVETDDWTVVDRVLGGGLGQPHAIAFSPDGGRAFVSNNVPPPGEPSSTSSAGSPPKARLVVIDTTTREIEASLELGPNLTGMGHRNGG